MKNILLVLLSVLVLHLFVSGQSTPTITSQTEAQWWAEAKALAQKTAQLKQARYDANAVLRARLYQQAELELAQGTGKSRTDIYDELWQKAAPEFTAIQQRYDPPIAEALTQYLTFLRARTPSDAPIVGATKSVRPEILYKEKAKYTETARQNRVQGSVIVSAVFRADGTMGDFKVVRGLPDGLSDEAINAAREIVFLPAVKDGVPVSVRMSLELIFRLL